VANRVQMLGKRVGVEPLNKATPKKESLFVTPDSSRNIGIIIYAGDASGFTVGVKVYFGNKYERLPMEGKDILVMESENVLATVEENQEETPASEKSAL